MLIHSFVLFDDSLKVKQHLIEQLTFKYCYRVNSLNGKSNKEVSRLHVSIFWVVSSILILFGSLIDYRFSRVMSVRLRK
jgi:hypothetical protein